MPAGWKLTESAASFDRAIDALDGGVAVIYQELNLVPEMSVAENIWLGHFSTKGPFVDFKELDRKARESLKRVGLEVDPGTRAQFAEPCPEANGGDREGAHSRCKGHRVR